MTAHSTTLPCTFAWRATIGYSGSSQDTQRGRNQRNEQAQQEDQRGRQQNEQQQRADQNNANRQRQAEQQQQVQAKKDANRQRQAEHQAEVHGRNDARQAARLPRERQQVLITEQQARRVEYRRHLEEQRDREQEWAAQLQQQKRMTYYRYQQDYWARMRRQQLALQNNYNYNNDPYFYTASNYRYSYGGNNFETNQYGANTLRAAINNGYSEGYRAGQADRQDRWQSNYQGSYAYQDANLGYNGNYVNQGDYNYYFREGFNRGYQDGYGNQMQYGQYSNGNRSILGTILSSILNLQSIR